MNNNNQTIRILSADQITINLAQAELAKHGIGARIQNDFESGVMAGFMGGIPTAIDLYVLEEDAEAALRIIGELMST